MNINLTLANYREILAGWEEDVEADQQAYMNALDDVSRLHKRLLDTREHVRCMKIKIEQMEKELQVSSGT